MSRICVPYSCVVLVLLTCFAYSVVSLAQGGDYKITAGDAISIQVYGEPELSFSKIIVPKRGSINFPFLGEIATVGKSESELSVLLTNRLKSGYLLDPQVTVSVVVYRPIFIGGAVNNPGRQPFFIDMDVEKVIAVGGGFTESADPDAIVILREDESGRHEIKVESNVKIQPGDVITVAIVPEEQRAEEDEKRYIYLYGEVKKPGRYEFNPGLSAEKAIAIAGGFGNRASKRKISVSRGTPAVINKKVALEYSIMPGDVITVGASLF